MRFHFVAVPVHDSAAAEEELNQFMASHRVLSVERQLVLDGGRSVWCCGLCERPGFRAVSAFTTGLFEAVAPCLARRSEGRAVDGPISQIVARSVIFSLPHRVTWCTPTSAM